MPRFKPNYDVKRFEIIITVHENCNSFRISNPDNNEIQYSEVIGALEINKAMLLYDQSEYNRQQYKKKKAVPEAEK